MIFTPNVPFFFLTLYDVEDLKITDFTCNILDSETWLNDSVYNTELFTNNNYQVSHQDRSTKRTGMTRVGECWLLWESYEGKQVF